MPACEKCWADAYTRSLSDPSKTQTEHYLDTLAEHAKQLLAESERKVPHSAAQQGEK